MAQLKEGSVIKKAGGDQVIATVDQIGVLEQRTSDPASPVDGQAWIRTDTNTLNIKFPSGVRTIATT